VHRELDYADPWPKANGDPNFICKNDGFQFHTTLIRLFGAGGTVGKLGYPYDPYTQMNYRLGGETENIFQHNITIRVNPQDTTKVSARVQRYFLSRWQVLDAKSAILEDGDSLELHGSMLQPLTLLKKSACEFQVTYAPNSQDPRWYSFTTDNAGYGNYANKDPNVTGNVRYCDITASGYTEITCTFPAW
jgi:hypothetical protein